MLSALPFVYRHDQLRLSAAGIFVFGFTGAATAPYMSLIGIRELGLTDAGFSILSFVAALVNVSASISMGILSDRLGHYKLPILGACISGALGYGVVYAFPTIWTFALALLIPVPVYGALNSLIFAYVRASCAGMPPRDLIAVNSAVRAAISLSWVLVPGIVGYALAGRTSMLPAFLLAAIACAFCFILFARFMREETIAHAERQEPAYAFLASIRHLGSRQIWPFVLAIALVSCTLHVNGIVLPLVVTGKAGGQPADVGAIVGIVALLEIVFIFFWGWVETKTSAAVAIAASALIYCAYMLGLGLAKDPMTVYLLTPLSGLGAAGIISLPITYLQNLIARRAGLGSSLIAVNIFLGGGLSSLLFSVGTAVSDYSHTAMLGAFAGLCGVALLGFLHKRPAVKDDLHTQQGSEHHG
ncbi:MFS transporter [Agrobacterium tumefaciens]|nr:MFS transporter [Agrobacterium tumefaciens]